MQYNQYNFEERRLKFGETVIIFAKISNSYKFKN